MSESTWDDPRITAYALGEMPAEEKAVFESELASDSALAAAVEEALGVTGQLQALYASESTPPLDSDRRDAIVGRGAGVTLPPAANSWRVPALVLAAAAVLLLLVGVAPWLRQQDATVAMEENERLDRPPVEGITKRDSSPIERAELAASANADASSSVSGSLASPDGPIGGIAVPAEKPMQQRGAGQVPKISQASPFEFHSPGAIAGKDAPVTDDSRPVAAEVAEALRTSRARVEQAAPSAPAPASAADSLGLADLKRKAAGVDHAPMPADQAEPAARGRQRVVSDQELLDSGGDLLRRVKEMKNAPEAQVEAVITPAPATAVREPNALKELEAQAGALGGGGSAGSGGGFAGRTSDKQRALLSKNPIIKEELGEREFLDLDVADPKDADPNGQGPESPGDQYQPITDNPFKRVSETPLSTFSVDVDTASYSKTRDFLMRAGQLPSPDAVRIEELINYFDYDYKAPPADAEHPFASYVEITTCPWNTEHQLARIALKGKTMTTGQRPPCNLVFLLDVSGSMNRPNKLPLVVEGMTMLIDQLNNQDRVAIVVYAGKEGLVLDSTSAKRKEEIKAALTRLSAGGSTNGGAGIALAYQTARDNFINDGVNRVILCTDGDFNVGVTDTAELVRMVEKESKGGIFLSVLGFGMGNHNDAMLEKISGRGNGNYSFIDTNNEARKVLVDQTNGTLVTIAKDVKFQIQFNPKYVAQYRLIGYENRILAKEDFNDDKKDAGEIGAGHAVTALYELVPPGQEADVAQPKVDELKYLSERELTAAAESDELLTLKLRYKQPDGDRSTLIETPIENNRVAFDKASDDVRFAAAVAGFGMKLRRSPYAGTWTWTEIQQVANSAMGEDDYELRAEFVELVRKASQLMGEQ